MKYSGATPVFGGAAGNGGPVQLEISDAGVGFDVEAAKRNEGLGLVSMQERVHLVNGAFSIESKVDRGTRIIATVPVVAEVGMAASPVASVSV